MQTSGFSVDHAELTQHVISGAAFNFQEISNLHQAPWWSSHIALDLFCQILHDYWWSWRWIFVIPFV